MFIVLAKGVKYRCKIQLTVLTSVGIKLKLNRENGVRDFATGAKVVKPNIYQPMEFVYRRLQFSKTISKESKRAAKYY
jgi:hypothetical protein